MDLYKILTVIFLLFISLACSNIEIEIEGEIVDCDFEQEISIPVGAIVIERNGSPYSMGSAFLIHEEDRRFVTNDHVIEMTRLYPSVEMKLFFECRVYDITLERMASIHDAALVYISNEVDTQRWPKPYSINRDTVSVGDKVNIQGVHRHLHLHHYRNVSWGYNDPPFFVRRDYYGWDYQPNPLSAWEFFFDDLEASVFEVDATKNVLYDKGVISGDMQEIRTSTNRFFSAKTKRNHVESFGGLSGGVVINQDREIVGIITLEEPQRWEIQPLPGDPGDTTGTVRQGLIPIRDVIAVTPVSEVMEIFRYHQDW